ncbi:MAG TPA: class I SAM-dependent methyltransferase [Acidobacteriaceae bacterium]|jgi:ubiquinone/menaquinone biosynthesis C-methylase UbiE|nr:class I SAM-dependent methyltransferase [Acidobacteriaceae bacterium]
MTNVNTATTAMPMPKPHRDRGIEGGMAQWYAKTTGKSMQEFQKLAQRIARELPEGGRVLEVAPGPGYFCIELAKLGPYAVTGVDLSQAMVEIARKKAAEAGVKAEFQQGNSANLPFARESFDFLVCRAAFKNFAQPVKALQEMHRVLKPGGRALVIDLRRDASWGDVSRAVNEMGLGLVNRAITKLTFRFMLLKNAYAREHFEHMTAQTAFSEVEIREDGIGFEVWMVKDRE